MNVSLCILGGSGFDSGSGSGKGESLYVIFTLPPLYCPVHSPLDQQDTHTHTFSSIQVLADLYNCRFCRLHQPVHGWDNL